MSPGAEVATVALQASTDANLRVLADLADFWKIPYSIGPRSTSNQIVFSSGLVPESSREQATTVVSPWGYENARRISDRFNLSLDLRTTVISLPFSRRATISISMPTYVFKGSQLDTVIDSEGTPILSRLASSNIYLLSIDLVSEMVLRLAEGLEDHPSIMFRLATLLPLSYRMIPSFLRNRAFRRDERPEITSERLAPIECLRTTFLASIVSSSKTPVPLIAFWRKGKKFAAAVTHDVETGEGLSSGAPELIRVEQELGIHSTWNIVTNRYQLTGESLKPLSESGEIGAHDTDHDGRLIFLSPDQRTERLKSCRETLERLSESKVKGFRAPLLQHDKELLGAVGKAGFVFDSSVPSWELLSPTSLRSHGIGTVFPLEIEGIVELPVSLPQDHQLLRVRGLTPSESGEVLRRDSDWLKEIGALATLLVHPDYDFSSEAHSDEYSKVLENLSQDPDCDLMTLGEVADWWSRRSKAKLEVTKQGLTVDCAESASNQDLQVQVATSFGKNGLTVTRFS